MQKILSLFRINLHKYQNKNEENYRSIVVSAW